MPTGNQIEKGELQHPLKGKTRVDLFKSGIQKLRAETLTCSEEWANGVES